MCIHENSSAVHNFYAGVRHWRSHKIRGQASTSLKDFFLSGGPVVSIQEPLVPELEPHVGFILHHKTRSEDHREDIEIELTRRMEVELANWIYS
jgi:hypothetical protein